MPENTDTLTTNQPLVGRTYSLYGHSQSTEAYYNLISDLADAALRECPDIRALLARLRRISRRVRWVPALKGWATLFRPFERGETTSSASADRKRVAQDFSPGNLLAVYTPGVKRHLRRLSPIKRLTDPALATTERQYHLYMLEIELVNRLNGEAFRQAVKKIALLPHCLRDFSRECLARDDGIDLVCRRCSKICRMRALSDLLRRHDITPYIWMNADFKDHHRALQSGGESFGLLGVACLPELASGMRTCMKAGIPVVGLPLDANRCARWLGEFHENTVNLDRLEKLIVHHGDTENTVI